MQSLIKLAQMAVRTSKRKAVRAWLMCCHLPDMQKTRNTKEKCTDDYHPCSDNPTFLHMKVLFFKVLKWAVLRAELVFPGEVSGGGGEILVEAGNITRLFQ